MTRLYVDLVKDSLTEFSYDASLAGLQYDLGSTILGLSMTLSGYNDKLHVLKKARNLDVREDRLAVIKENVGYLSELYDPETGFEIILLFSRSSYNGKTSSSGRPTRFRNTMGNMFWRATNTP